jgi:hypothetical protein
MQEQDNFFINKNAIKVGNSPTKLMENHRKPFVAFWIRVLQMN